MALIRVIRPLPIKPTREKLRRLMQEYGLTRPTTARLMRVSVRALGFYLQSPENKEFRNIPLARWELLLVKIAAIYHPDEPVEMQL